MQSQRQDGPDRRAGIPHSDAALVILQIIAHIALPHPFSPSLQNSFPTPIAGIMSRYRQGPPPGPDYREMPYREGPPRWDRDSFARAERDRYAGPPVIEQQRPPYAEPYSPPRRGAPVYEEDRYYEQDRYGPGGRQERRYWEEDQYYREDPRATGGAMIPFRPERAPRPEPPGPVAPPRMVRRQSSLDFYDRRAPRREFYDDRGPPARAPPQRGYYDRQQYDDVQVQDPYAYGDDGFREYREREWVRRRRNSSGSRSRSRSRSRARSELVESVKEERPYPRRGKTKMPKRLVHTKVLYDLGYPYYEEVSAS